MNRAAPFQRNARQYGFAYVEVVIATLLLLVALVPALEALQTGVQSGAQHASKALGYNNLASRMEEVLAEPFTSLAAAAAGQSVASSYSDSAGTPDRIIVYLARYDGDNVDGDGNPFTGGDDNLLWVRVEREGTVQMLDTLTSSYE